VDATLLPPLKQAQSADDGMMCCCAMLFVRPLFIYIKSEGRESYFNAVMVFFKRRKWCFEN